MSDQRRIERLVILVSAGEKDLVSRAAGEAGLPVSAFVRSRLLDGTPNGTPGNIPDSSPASEKGAPKKNRNGTALESRVRQLRAQGHTGPAARQIAEREGGSP